MVNFIEKLCCYKIPALSKNWCRFLTTKDNNKRKNNERKIENSKKTNWLFVQLKFNWGEMSFNSKREKRMYILIKIGLRKKTRSKIIKYHSFNHRSFFNYFRHFPFFAREGNKVNVNGLGDFWVSSLNFRLSSNPNRLWLDLLHNGKKLIDISEYWDDPFTIKIMMLLFLFAWLPHYFCMTL